MVSMADQMVDHMNDNQMKLTRLVEGAHADKRV